jgi:Mlc titration factor MtfA (ptsG expression regulator)
MTTESTHAGRLGTAWERRTRRDAWIATAAVAAVSVALVLVLRGHGLPPFYGVLAAAVATWSTHLLTTRKLVRRRRILAEPFPAEWEAVLQAEVAFFRALDPAEQVRFRREVQTFLGEKRVTGIKTEVDARTRVLVAASAVIPIFGFPEWEWDQINEVLVYPSRFDGEFRLGRDSAAHTLGMVGTGLMNGLMILAKPDLVQGFRNPGDKRNVGLHEFAHLVDKADGQIDGIPAVGLDRQALGPWVELVRGEMAAIADGKSDLDRYALTNEAEFFAVATEYFFERPGVMQRKHPELFAMLERVFGQDLRSRITALRREIARGPRKFGRNSPCPCGSGLKYKKCCLR